MVLSYWWRCWSHFFLPAASWNIAIFPHRTESPCWQEIVLCAHAHSSLPAWVAANSFLLVAITLFFLWTAVLCNPGSQQHSRIPLIETLLWPSAWNILGVPTDMCVAWVMKNVFTLQWFLFCCFCLFCLFWGKGSVSVTICCRSLQR